MPQETAFLTQKAVLWEHNGQAREFDNYAAQVITEPIEINVRWEAGKRETPSLTSDGQIATDVVMLDRKILVGSLLRLGKLNELPTPLTDVRQVADYQEVPDVKGRYIQRTALLVAYHDTLPINP